MFATATSTASSKATAVVRPYSSYNLFFQLERQYILQTLLDFDPQISSPSELFDPNDTSNYSGPPLPSRYANLILPKDWHIPGKTKRRDRKHRKSHGKIGFHELNERISKSWQVVDAETKEFCRVLSEMEHKKFKFEHIHETKANETIRILDKAVKNKNGMSTTKQLAKDNMETKKNDHANYSDSFDWTWSSVTMQEESEWKHEEIVPQATSASRHHQQLMSSDDNRSKSVAEVDLTNDEIINMWKKHHIEKREKSPVFYTQYCGGCVDITSQSASIYSSENTAAGPTTSNTAKCLEDDSMNNKQSKRMSFIDGEYEKFQDIGKQYSKSKQKRWIPCTKIRKNSVTPAQA